MICQHCKKREATFNYIEIVNGDKFESHLCARCYSELYGELNSKANNEIWAGLFGESAPAKRTCPVCGTSYSDYEATGLLGCASCYDFFKEELLPSIQRIQGKVTHVGKVGNNNDDYGLHRKLKALKEELEIALRKRNYLEADRLNKQIKEVSKKLYRGEEDV